MVQLISCQTFPQSINYLLLLRQPGRIWPCRGPEGKVQGAAAGQPGQETWAKFTLYIQKATVKKSAFLVGQTLI